MPRGATSTINFSALTRGRVLEIVAGEEIDDIRLSTTVATSALLERKGHRRALIRTKGCKALLLIGNQSRTKIFELNIRRPPLSNSTVTKMDVGCTSVSKAEKHVVQLDDKGRVVTSIVERDGMDWMVLRMREGLGGL